MKEELVKSLQNMNEEKITQLLAEGSNCPDDFYMAGEHTCDFYKGSEGCIECWKKAKSKFQEW